MNKRNIGMIISSVGVLLLIAIAITAFLLYKPKSDKNKTQGVTTSNYTPMKKIISRKRVEAKVILEKMPEALASLEKEPNADLLLNYRIAIQHEVEDYVEFVTDVGAGDVDLVKLLKFNMEMINFFIEDKKKTMFNRTLDWYLKEPLDSPIWTSDQMNEDILLPTFNTPILEPEKCILQVTLSALGENYNPRLYEKLVLLKNRFMEVLTHQKKSLLKSEGRVISELSKIRAMRLILTMNIFGFRVEKGEFTDFLIEDLFADGYVPIDIVLFCIRI